MNIIVKSRKEAEIYSAQPHTEQAIVISIAAVGQEKASISCTKENGIRDIAFLFFNDVSNETDEGHITDDDAQTIKEFVNKYKDTDIDTILVHCVAGQCRSAGVASAISLYLLGNDDQVYANSYCVPNALCKSKVLKAFNGDTDYASIFGF